MKVKPTTVLYLKVPIWLWNAKPWREIEDADRKQLGKDEGIRAMATQDRLGQQIVFVRKADWQKMTPRERGRLLTHELLHTLRNKRYGTRKRRAACEERFVRRSMPRRTLKARILHGREVVLTD